MIKRFGKKVWKIVKKVDQKIAHQFPRMSPVILQILVNRGIKNIDHFLRPDFAHGQHSPLLLFDAQKACARILKAIEKREKIVIFGHYDCDGVCAAALLGDALKKLHANFEVYIPTRGEGYQIKKKLIADFQKREASLLITVDYGISDFEAAKMCQKSQIDLIIIDHHQPPKKLPKAHALVNPHLSSKYPFKDLSGTGVVYKVVSLLIPDERFLKWSLDLVALATIADVVPLVDENRVFTKFGLIVLQKTKRLGLKSLYQKSGIDANKINTYSIGFQIAPRLNAAGRIDHALQSYYLLTTKNVAQADRISEKLNRLNSERQAELDKSLSEALRKISKDKLDKEKLIVVSDDNWAEGVLGLIAGKVTELFTRPSIIFRRDKGLLTGSARSIDQFHITDALREYEDILERVGGHKKAAGLTLKSNLFQDFYDKLINYASKKISNEDILPKIYIDAEVPLKQVNDQFWRNIQLLEPYGYGNPKPNLVTRNLRVENIKAMGQKSKHISLSLTDGEIFIRAVGFEMGEWLSKIKPNDKIDVVYNLEMNSWNGNNNLELRLVDIKEQT